MNNYFVIKKYNGGKEAEKEVIAIIGATTYSTGDGLELTSRYGYDASRLPQSLTKRKRNTALTATMNINFTPALCIQSGVEIPQYISTLEGLVGDRVTLYWQGRERGDFIIKSVQFSTAIDTYSIFSEVSVSINLQEGWVANPQPYTAVRA